MESKTEIDLMPSLKSDNTRSLLLKTSLVGKDLETPAAVFENTLKTLSLVPISRKLHDVENIYEQNRLKNTYLPLNTTIEPLVAALRAVSLSTSFALTDALTELVQEAVKIASTPVEVSPLLQRKYQTFRTKYNQSQADAAAEQREWDHLALAIDDLVNAAYHMTADVTDAYVEGLKTNLPDCNERKNLLKIIQVIKKQSLDKQVVFELHDLNGVLKTLNQFFAATVPWKRDEAMRGLEPSTVEMPYPPLSEVARAKALIVAKMDVGEQEYKNRCDAFASALAGWSRPAQNIVHQAGQSIFDYLKGLVDKKKNINPRMRVLVGQAMSEFTAVLKAPCHEMIHSLATMKIDPAIFSNDQRSPYRYIGYGVMLFSVLILTAIGFAAIPWFAEESTILVKAANWIWSAVEAEMTIGVFSGTLTAAGLAGYGLFCRGKSKEPATKLANFKSAAKAVQSDGEKLDLVAAENKAEIIGGFVPRS